MLSYLKRQFRLAAMDPVDKPWREARSIYGARIIAYLVASVAFGIVVVGLVWLI